MSRRVYAAVSVLNTSPRTAGKLLVLCAIIAGCNGSHKSGEQPPESGSPRDLSDYCSLDVTLSGAVDTSQSPTQGITCAYPDSLHSDVEIKFVPGATLSSLTLTVQGITEGATGSFPATVRIVSGGRTWATADGSCTVNVGDHSLDLTIESQFGERTYDIRGSGSCPTPAVIVAPDVSGDVTIAPFQFTGLAVWVGDAG